MRTRQNIQSIYQKKCCEEKHVDLLLTREGEKYTMFLSMILTLFLLHRGRKHFCRYCLHAFITEEILKRHIKDCFKINGKQKRLRFLRKMNMLNQNILKEK